MTREEKAQVVAELKEVMDRASGMYFTDFQGMTVEQTTNLRNELRKAGVTYKVAKNTLIRRALEDTLRELNSLTCCRIRAAYGREHGQPSKLLPHIGRHMHPYPPTLEQTLHPVKQNAGQSSRDVTEKAQ